MCQEKIVAVVIMHFKNEIYDYIFNKKTTHAFVGDHKIFVKFVSKRRYNETILLLVEGVNHLCVCRNVLLTALMKHYLISTLFLSRIFHICEQLHL